jgi:hypothetical protein
MRALLLLVLLLSATPSEAQMLGVEEYYAKFLAPLAQRHAPIFLARCKLSQGKAIVFYPMGDKKGAYAEFADDGTLVNGADVTVGKKIAIADLSDGLASIKRGRAIIEELVRSPFRLVPPQDLKSTLTSAPTRNCRSGG